MTIIHFDRPIAGLFVAIAKPPAGSYAKPVTLSGHATLNRKLLGV
jgi:hypothetical protein